MGDPPGGRWRPPRNVVVLSAVSFLTDVSSEMIAPLLPLFLVGTLGAPVVMVGVIEGGADALASLLKLGSGWWSDRVRRRKPLIVGGYALAALARPCMALAQGAGQVLAIRLVDRVGKGVRGAPRDALLAAATQAADRGRAFGLHRAADHAGAVVGTLVAVGLLHGGTVPLRTVFALAAVPGALAVAVALWGVREVVAPAHPGAAHAAAPAPAGAPPGPCAPSVPADPLPRPFWWTLAALLLFALGNATDAYLLLRAQELGVPLAAIPLVWALLHLVKSASSTPAGALSDRLGRRPLIVAGWLWYAAVYAGFALVPPGWMLWALVAAYGVVFGLTEGAEKALVADLVPAARRGTAFGWYHATLGVAALPASVLFGALWSWRGAPVAFGTGAVLAVMAAGLLLAGPQQQRTPPPLR
jgi:MFS family permease